MQYKDYIKPGNKCIYVPSYHPFATDDEKFGCEYDEWFGNALKLVEISKYHPHFTNDLPDPTPDEYDSLCVVETYSEQDGPIQAYFAQLLDVVKPDEDITCIYKNKCCPVIGYDPTEEYYVIEHEGKTIVRPSFQIQIERNIEDLTFDELKELRGQICVGSLYISDYRNGFGVDPNIVFQYSDNYIDDLYRIFNEDVPSEHDTPEAFANFICYGRSYPDIHGVYIIQVRFDGDSVWQGFDNIEYYDDDVDYALWQIKRDASESRYEFRKVYVGFENMQTLKAKRK